MAELTQFPQIPDSCGQDWQELFDTISAQDLGLDSLMFQDLPSPSYFEDLHQVQESCPREQLAPNLGDVDRAVVVGSSRPSSSGGANTAEETRAQPLWEASEAGSEAGNAWRVLGEMDQRDSNPEMESLYWRIQVMEQT